MGFRFWGGGILNFYCRDFQGAKTVTATPKPLKDTQNPLKILKTQNFKSNRVGTLVDPVIGIRYSFLILIFKTISHQFKFQLNKRKDREQTFSKDWETPKVKKESLSYAVYNTQKNIFIVYSRQLFISYSWIKIKRIISNRVSQCLSLVHPKMSSTSVQLILV